MLILFIVFLIGLTKQNCILSDPCNLVAPGLGVTILDALAYCLIA